MKISSKQFFNVLLMVGVLHKAPIALALNPTEECASSFNVCQCILGRLGSEPLVSEGKQEIKGVVTAIEQLPAKVSKFVKLNESGGATFDPLYLQMRNQIISDFHSAIKQKVDSFDSIAFDQLEKEVTDYLEQVRQGEIGLFEPKLNAYEKRFEYDSLKDKKPREFEINISSTPPIENETLLNYLSRFKNDENFTQTVMLMTSSPDLAGLLLAEIQISHPREFQLIIESLELKKIKEEQVRLQNNTDQMKKRIAELTRQSSSEIASLKDQLQKLQNQMAQNSDKSKKYTDEKIKNLGDRFSQVIHVVVIIDIILHLIF